MNASHAISTLRRDLAVGRGLRIFLFAMLIVGLAVSDAATRMVLLLTVGSLWIAMTIGSRRGSVLAAGVPSLIASGQYEQAEEQITAAIRSFSLFRQGKLISLHHLAALRLAQQRWPEAIVLAQALLSQKLGPLAGLARSARLILAESAIELGDFFSAHAAITELYTDRLPIGDAVKLLRIQLDYEAHVGAWDKMLDGVPAKVKLIELLPAGECSAAHASLALAARRVGRTDLEEFFCRRAGLLTDIQQLVARRPMLRELWA